MPSRIPHPGAALLACAAALAAAGGAPRAVASTGWPGGTFTASWVSADLAETTVSVICASPRQGATGARPAKLVQMMLAARDPLADARLAYLAGTSVPYHAATLRIGSEVYHLTDVTLDDSGPASARFAVHAASLAATVAAAPPEPQTAEIVSGAATPAPVASGAPAPPPVLALVGIGMLNVTMAPRDDASGAAFFTTLDGTSGSRLLPACFEGRAIDGGAFVGGGKRRSFAALRVIEISEHAGAPPGMHGAGGKPSMVVHFAFVARPQPSPSPSP